ncbi:hypothetical protein FRC15_007245 [Serendipita sp. 397]|nr:hypothetical protein FRC15_007245 [Serendipita sp. 397]
MTSQLSGVFQSTGSGARRFNFRTSPSRGYPRYHCIRMLEVPRTKYLFGFSLPMHSPPRGGVDQKGFATGSWPKYWRDSSQKNFRKSISASKCNAVRNIDDRKALRFFDTEKGKLQF